MNEENQTVEVVEDDKQVAAEPEQVTTDPKDEKKYTDADVDAIIDKKFAKWKAEQEKAESEAKKLAKMNAEDKQKYQLDKREQDLADREAEITRRELTAEAKTILSERGLPIELVDVVNLADADSVRDSIDAIQKTWEAAVLKGVADKTKGSAPMKKAPVESGEITKEQFNRMGVRSRNELFERDPELYRKLRG
ncbi:TPA: DUF4355 domain-containing protein [Streptococcus suis]|uniref:DUF4355 domain-containing protein n=2 Tax=Streptococcus suis TaxID=1307 RepID=UPI000CF5910A|nr:DUF4355 domain-containing protein [Streptococcus suis]MDW8720865.1 DUF4355 domain-containing protein [Streptococcus suis]WNF68993.1 DUF4355 domain-containing protein [Streptococcus suis]HEL1580642.1 DUF4355 domain-containing protein [Streptococcus suis]HEL1658056.1 DUF4355 domain-containing protein [Streptococcus suis]HEL1673712.1 DUF4355 domain-containing protein [Streptococcus suis]